MSKRQGLSQADLTAGTRLAHECLALGFDSDLWHVYLYEGLNRLIGAVFASGGESERLGDGKPKPKQLIRAGPMEMTKTVAEYIASGEMPNDVFLRPMFRERAPLIAYRRRDRVPDDKL